MAQDFKIHSMRSMLFLLLTLYTACTLPEEKKANKIADKSRTTVIEANDENLATHSKRDNQSILDTSNSIALPAVQQIKSPGGIYQATIADDNVKQTIAFNKDFTYQMQEHYFSNEKDSIVTTEGTWMPSDGFIWLYKEQVTRGRYKWKGDTLQFYSPVSRKNFSMHHLQEAIENPAWKNRKGLLLAGAGNEPFWSVELDRADSVSFSLADWNHPLKLKLDSSFNNNDSTGYFARNDSAQVRVTVFPQFCTDGMSGFVFRNKVRVQYNQKVFKGCAVLYK